MNFIPTQLNVKPAKELSRAVAAELEKKEDSEFLKALVKKKVEEDDIENKLSQDETSVL